MSEFVSCPNLKRSQFTKKKELSHFARMERKTKTMMFNRLNFEVGSRSKRNKQYLQFHSEKKLFVHQSLSQSLIDMFLLN